MSKIKEIIARQVLDSRGNPTVEVTVWTEHNAIGRAAVPSGASTGQHEAVELRDKDAMHYQGYGVQKAIHHVNTLLREALVGHAVVEQSAVDHLMIALDGTPNKAYLGANALLGVSLAIAKAAACTLGIPLYRYIGGIQATTLPRPMMNLLHGGVHAHNPLTIQEFMIIPVQATCFSEALHMGVGVLHALRSLLQEKGLPTTVGDEGGFAPMLRTNEEAMDYLLQAIERAGYRPGEDVGIALDAASTSWYDPQQQVYTWSACHAYTAPELVAVWEKWLRTYPILSLEDGMAEDDWPGWQLLTQEVGHRVQLVGDDLFVTNTKRLQKGIAAQVANAIIIKMNQVGTLSETLHTVRLATEAGYRSIISHRSGETEDTTVADLAVALNVGQIKTGAPSRSDRTAKYNQLLRIEAELGSYAGYAGHTI